QFHFPSSDAPSCRAKFQPSSLTCGVGPAERTGKSVVTYCPGGTRFFGVCSCRLDLKPREIGVSSIVLPAELPAMGKSANCWIQLFMKLEKTDPNPGPRPYRSSPATLGVGSFCLQ